VNVNVLDGSASVTMSQQITYDFVNTPIVSSVTPSSSLSVLGNKDKNLVLESVFLIN